MKAIEPELSMSLNRPVSVASFVLSISLLTLTFLSGCLQKESRQADIDYSNHIDTTVSVYGPYVALKLPVTKGVKIANPVQLALGPEDVLYAANQTGEVYSLQDTDQDGLEDMALLYCNVKDFGLRSPSGFTHRGDTIYVGTAQQIRAFRDQDRDGKADTSWVFFDDIPNSEHPYEWTNGLNFGPDGWLYVTLCSDSWNVAPAPDPEGYRGAILKISPDGKRAERIASGIRSVYDMAFNQHGDLFFADNEGGGNPTEELNRWVKDGFYGHNPSKYTFESVLAAEYDLETEVAPSGMEFNREDNDFGGTAGNLFIAFYGPGERWTRGGVGRVQMQRLPNGSYAYQEFPVADIPKISNLAFGKDGALYLAKHGKADYWYNAVYENEGSFYKLIHVPSHISVAVKTRQVHDASYSKNTIETGKQLFAELACLGCHSMDGSTELLGPNLKDVGKRLTREEILEEILKPSERIKPSMLAVRVTKKDGKALIGRVVHADEKEISLMLTGNHIIKIDRQEVEKTEDEMKSLMYEGLLTGISDAEQEALLDFIMSASEAPNQ